MIYGKRNINVVKIVFEIHFSRHLFINVHIWGFYQIDIFWVRFRGLLGNGFQNLLLLINEF